MRRSIAVIMLSLGWPALAKGQQIDNPRPASYPPGSIGSASRAHALTIAEVRAVLDVEDSLKRVPDHDRSPQRRAALSDSSDLAAAVAVLEREPATRRALAGAKLSPGDYLVANSALVETMEAVMLQRILGTYAPATKGRWENVALYRANQAELDKRLGLDDLDGRSRSTRADSTPAPAPKAGSLAAAAAAHVLTMDEIRRTVAAMREEIVMERSDPALHALLELDESDVPLAQRAADFARVKGMREALARHGFDPSAFLVAQGAFSNLLESVIPPGSPASLARVPEKNVVLYHEHEAEIFSLATSLAEALGADERTQLQVDSVYQRRLRTTDSLSRFVPTDSLARLFIRAIDVPDPALAEVAQALSCEIVRMNWRYGVAPTAAAVHRMSDSLWAGRQEVFERTSARIYAYSMSAPMTDAVCHQSRWPKAADSLDVRPRPGAPSHR